MRRVSFAVLLLLLLASLFLLSVLSNLLTGHFEGQFDEGEEQTGRGSQWIPEEEAPVLLFKVFPSTPRMYWRVSTADYYTGVNWLRTTDERVAEELIPVQDTDAAEVFTVQLNLSQRETLLPLPPPDSPIASISAPLEDSEIYVDGIGGTYKIVKRGQAEVPLVYEVAWHDVEVDDSQVSLDSIPEEIVNRYLQLPDMPLEVQELAMDLENPTYSIVDQILADVQYLRTSFVYDSKHSQSLYELIPQGANVLSYMERREGVCIDAATALAVILRVQGIPARISIGYKPGRIEGGQLLYYKDRAHAVTEAYLPPYGWIQFDATPPQEEDPLMQVSPFKGEGSPGSRLLYRLSITNRRNFTDTFRLFIQNQQKWHIEVAPVELWIEALQTADALLDVIIPEDAEFGGKNVATVTVTPFSHSEAAFSIVAITQVEDTSRVSTTTTIRSIDQTVTRGDTLWLNGTVRTASDEQVDNMTVFVFLAKGKETEGLIAGKGCSGEGGFQIKCRIPYLVEIGAYRVVPISLGSSQYAPSSTEALIKVRARTRMEFGSEERFLLGYGAIHGRLIWDNGTGFAGAAVSLKITSSRTPSQVWESQNLTFSDGSFRINTLFDNPGVYEAKALFLGNEHALESNATRIVEFKRGLPILQLFGEHLAVRGKIFNITMRLRYETTQVWGEPVDVFFDDHLLTTIETRDNGSYTWPFLVGHETTLGSHTFSAALGKGNVSAVHKVEVKSEARLTAEVSEIAGGMFILFSASLCDDHDLPIHGAEITIDNYGVSWKTDENGDLAFLLDTVKLWPQNLTLNARFEGSEAHLPTTSEKEIVLDALISLPFLIPLIAPTSAVMSYVCVKHLAGKLRAFRQTSVVEAAKERAAVEEEPIYTPRIGQPLKMVLHDIKAPFPNVWGFEDELRVRISLDREVLAKASKRRVDVFIDEKPAASVELSEQHHAELSYVFTEKGEHKIRASLLGKSDGRSLNAEITLRIVDYGEEMIDLYKEFLEKLPTYSIHAGEEMTAREIERLLLKTSTFDPEALSEVTMCFEKAEYSNHSASRGDYETMFLSLTGLNITVEQKE